MRRWLVDGERREQSGVPAARSRSRAFAILYGPPGRRAPCPGSGSSPVTRAGGTPTTGRCQSVVLPMPLRPNDRQCTAVHLERGRLRAPACAAAVMYAMDHPRLRGAAQAIALVPTSEVKVRAPSGWRGSRLACLRRSRGRRASYRHLLRHSPGATSIVVLDEDQRDRTPSSCRSKSRERNALARATAPDAGSSSIISVGLTAAPPCRPRVGAALRATATRRAFPRGHSRTDRRVAISRCAFAQLPRSRPSTNGTQGDPVLTPSTARDRDCPLDRRGREKSRDFLVRASQCRASLAWLGDSWVMSSPWNSIVPEARREVGRR